MLGATIRFLKNRTGAAALEFAIVAPLLFAAVLGTFETGRALYQQNHLSGAVAAGARSITLNGATDDNAIRTAIYAKYKGAEKPRINIALSQQTISGQTFKRISVTYDHDFIVKFGSNLSGLTLTATRYVPAL